MSIEKMKMVNIIGDYDELNDTIQAYLDSGCFQPESAAQLIENVKGFTIINDENPYCAPLNKLTDIFDSIGINVTPTKVAEKSLTDDEINEQLLKIDDRLGYLTKNKIKLDKQILDIEDSIEKLSHFTGVGVELPELLSSKFVKVQLGKMPVESYKKLKYYNSNPYVLFTPNSNDGSFIWGAYITPLSVETEIDNIFNSLYFERVSIPNKCVTPAEAIVLLKEELEKLKNDCNELKSIISEFNDAEMKEYSILYTQLKRMYETFEVRKYATKYENSFMLVGWVPERKIKHFETFMDKLKTVKYTFDSPDTDSGVKPPIKLKNFKFAKPFEYYVEMFGVPNYNEIDPTLFMAITYTLLYGIMFADVGQGIILSIVGFLMYKLKGMELGKILIPCGICGTIFGLVFGSVFGFEHLLDPMYHALGFEEKPIEVMSSINSILISSVAIGVVMMVLAICLNIASCLKRRNIGEALASENGLCGLLLYISIITLVLGVLSQELAFLSTPAIATIVVTALIIMFKEPIIHFINREKFKREAGVAEFVMQSFFEAFEALLSYITNTVSFLRVGAFVLVHNGMMMVFFTLAEMIGEGVGYAVVIIFGNILVLVLEGLLVGIQSLRLEFYEMFSRFYSGEGKLFKPAKIGANNI